MSEEVKDLDFDSRIIKMASNEAYLEVFDALNLPYPQHYCMLQGRVGKQFAYSSGLRLQISKYNRTTKKGEGSSSILLPSELFSEMLAFMANELGKPSYENLSAYLAGLYNKQSQQMAAIDAKLTSLSNMVMQFMADVTTGAAKAITSGSADINSVLTVIGAAGKNAVKAATGKIPGSYTGVPADTVEPADINPYSTWSANVIKGHDYKKREDGKCHVSACTISYNPVLKKDGQKTVMLLPWNIKVEEYYATPVETETGGTSYSGIDETSRKSYTFRVSTRGMFSLCKRCEEFLSEWYTFNAKFFKDSAQATKEAKARLAANANG